MPRKDDLRELEALATLMDGKFRVPGTNIRFGLDAVIGLVPGIGDGIVALPAAHILYKARKLGAPSPLIARMAANMGVDALVGSIPLIGDLLDIGFKANQRNVSLLREHMMKQARTDRAASPGWRADAQPAAS